VSDGATGFEWDPFKAQINFEKHGVSFAEAAKTLLGLTLSRPAIDGGENRFASIGITGERLIVVIWTPRHDAMRVISARRARRYERKAFSEAVGQAGRIAAAD
jgi:uncharacterized DUF497 family protein